MLVDQYYPIAVFVLVAIMFPVLAFVTAKFFRPTKYSTLRDTTYECGMDHTVLRLKVKPNRFLANWTINPIPTRTQEK